MPTLKQEMLLKKLPENNFNLYKTAKEVGYSESYANSRIYDYVRKCKGTKDYFDSEQVKKRIKKIYKRLESSDDATNINRSLELQAKIAGIVINRQEIENKNPDKIIISYGEKQSPTTIPTTPDDKPIPDDKAT